MMPQLPAFEHPWFTRRASAQACVIALVLFGRDCLPWDRQLDAGATRRVSGPQRSAAFDFNADDSGPPDGGDPRATDASVEPPERSARDQDSAVTTPSERAPQLLSLTVHGGSLRTEFAPTTYAYEVRPDWLPEPIAITWTNTSEASVSLDGRGTRDNRATLSTGEHRLVVASTTSELVTTYTVAVTEADRELEDQLIKAPEADRSRSASFAQLLHDLPQYSHGDRFGQAIAAQGAWLMVGAPGESSHIARRGDYEDPSYFHSGALYVLHKDGQAWRETQFIKAPDAEAVDDFGGAVALDGDVLVVGAGGRDFRPGVEAELIPDTGAAYIFSKRTGSNGELWQHLQTLQLPEAERAASDNLGTSVAVSGDVIAVSYFGPARRGVEIFRRDGDTFLRAQTLRAAATEASGYGRRIAMHGKTLAVAEWTEGVIYLYEPNEAGEFQQLAAARGEPLRGFGESIALDDTQLVVGSSASGPTSATGPKGEVYIFRRDDLTHPTVFGPSAALTSSQRDKARLFGYAVALRGNLLVVGAPSLALMDGTPPDAAGTGYGELFYRDGEAWQRRAVLSPRRAQNADALGMAVALTELGHVLFAAPWEDRTTEQGMLPPSADDAPAQDVRPLDSGAVYVFR